MLSVNMMNCWIQHDLVHRCFGSKVHSIDRACKWGFLNVVPVNGHVLASAPPVAEERYILLCSWLNVKLKHTQGLCQQAEGTSQVNWSFGYGMAKSVSCITLCGSRGCHGLDSSWKSGFVFKYLFKNSQGHLFILVLA